MKRPAQVHYLPDNAKIWSPPTVAFFTTVTEPIPDVEPETLRMVGWHATVVARRDVKPNRPARVDGTGTSPLSLAEWLVEHTRGRETTWIFTHNAPLDLISSRLPVELHKLGWSINDASLSKSAPWIRLAKGSRRFCVVDSFSWLPHTIADLAERVGEPQPHRLVDESPGDWASRSAKADVGVIGNAMLSLMEWWDKHELGKWSVSGASTGWHAMRHIPANDKVVIDPDPDRVAADRAAIYGGRRGAWLVGTRSLGPFLELDFANAYPSVGADLPLPKRRGASFDSMALDNWRLTSERWGVIAEVDLSTMVPRWPVRFKGGTFCPIGSFRTTLAGPEIRDAVRLGCLTRVGPGTTHQLGYHLQNWARWDIDIIRNTSGDEPVAAQLWAKATSRSVIGKWAARGYERVELGPSPIQDWAYEEGWDHGSQARYGTIHMAGEHWQSVVDGNAEQAYPAIFAWIESETRVRLSRVIEAIGEGAILQCDTDGLIVAERIIGTRAAGGHLLAPSGIVGAARTKWVLDCLDPIIAPLTIRVKRKHKTIRVLGPQHTMRGSERSFAGIPALATMEAPDVYKFKQWPGLSYQLGRGANRGYVRPETSVRVQGPYAPGWLCTDGRVIPVESRIRDDGTNQILGWDAMTTKPKGAKRAQTQHPVLARLW